MTMIGRLLVATLCILWSGIAALALAQDELQCSLTEQELNSPDPALQEMKYDVGDGEQTTLVYVEPPVASMYPPGEEPPSKTKVQPQFNGLAGKFINMSNKKLTLYWEQTKGGERVAMRHHSPFTASGTGTFPTHRFLFVDETTKQVVKTFIVGNYPNNLYAYDPYFVEGDPEATEKNLKAALSKSERAHYDVWRKTLKFHEYYLEKTGRSYLANYLRAPPMHFMWRADYFGQVHYVESRETHYTTEPSKNHLYPSGLSKSRKLTTPLLPEYRDTGVLNMTLKVLSVAPRVFEIDNFLSDVEVNHIVEMASGINLKKSQTGEGDQGEERVKDSTNTRTSYNSWVPRSKSAILDSIYRRAADLMRIDEALLRQRDGDEHSDRFSSRTLAEDLQLVHYDKAQEYTAHHDFGYSRVDATDKQGARFATLLLYLNEGMKGGETNFPRWANAHTFRDLRVTPKVGKAVLFYSQLPDGNLDDFSQHAALPVTDGEKVGAL